MKISIIKLTGLAFFIVAFISCKKQLDEKPSQNLVVPSTLNDLQALIDNPNLTQFPYPNTELPADNYYVLTADWQQQSSGNPQEALSYNWDNAIIYPSFSWTSTYISPVYYSNIVLDFLPGIKEGNNDTRNSIEGSALFIRAFAFERLAQLYCKPYSSSASADPGIVLKLSSDIEEPIVRSTVQGTYDQIINDLNTAAELLPVTTIYPTRPNKAAAYGELARVYLSMRDYINAGKYANLSLQQNSFLLDFNTLNASSTTPVPLFNNEINFQACAQTAGIIYSYGKIDSLLYQSYAVNDLRKTVYFQSNTGANAGTYFFKGSYYGPLIPFSEFNGITSSEMYLIRAESYARAGDAVNAMADLNTLLMKRWRTGTFVTLTATDATDAKNKILTERRKELAFRGQRWSDLRRFNLEDANITLKRILNATNYLLPPNDNRWVMLIPQEVINRSGLQQNPR
jgi:starch-binding outer membrane protein, SusD/RagB family